MIKKVVFNTKGYEPFIDFLKAYSILCVVIAHCIQIIPIDSITFIVLGGMQVPMFILIQVFHVFKRDERPKLGIQSLWSRIIFPFLITQFFIAVFYILTLDKSYLQLCKEFVGGGGYGPGSYYMWVYIQMAIILICIYPVVKKVTLKQLFGLFALLCIICEVLCSVIRLPEWLYRLMAIRYLFLIPLGYKWVKEGVDLSVKTIILSLLSIIAVLFFYKTNYDLEPLFFNTGWKTHRWICYYYVASLMTFFLYLLYSTIKNKKIINLFSTIGKASYEIFLFQMLMFAVLPNEWGGQNNSTVTLILKITFLFMSCVLGGCFLWKVKGIISKNGIRNGSV